MNINRRGAWAQQNPNYAGMNYDWNYTTIAIHHSGNSGETDPVEIERKHRERGFDDVGYHLLINQQGRIFEGRRLFCQGAHIRLGNTARVGVLVMGDFQHQWWDDDDDPTQAQLNSVVRICSVLTKYFKITNLGGHRDYGDSVCPGDELYVRIPDLRTRTGLGGP